jgi:hypothetical protein
MRRIGFRLWVLFALCFAGYLFWANGGRLVRAFEIAYSPPVFPYSWTVVPVDCLKARGAADMDYVKALPDPRLIDHSLVPMAEEPEVPGRLLCWYTLSRYRYLFAEFRHANDDDLIDNLYRSVYLMQSPRETPWLLLLRILTLAFGVPAAVLLTGRLIFTPWRKAGAV